MLGAMHSRRDVRFDDEAARFDLVFTCEECGHFDTARSTCAHEWPTELHRRERYRAPGPDVVFCKEFEAR
jgi:hypothetical protein